MEILNRRLRSVYGESVKRSEQTFRISEADYRVGRVGVLQVIDDHSELPVFRIQLTRLEANLGQRLASLERGIGCQLAESPQRVPVELAPAPDEDTEAPQPEDDR